LAEQPEDNSIHPAKSISNTLSAAAEAALNRYVRAAVKAAPILATEGDTSATLRHSLQQLRLAWRELSMAADAAAHASVMEVQP
jgi:hypothetical protein